MLLDETHTCFVRDGKTFCKKDYVRCVLIILWLKALISLLPVSSQSGEVQCYNCNLNFILSMTNKEMVLL